MSDLIVSLFMVAGAALAVGAVVLFRRGNRQQAGLMLIAAGVMFTNVGIWLAPTEDGATLANPDPR